MNKEFVYVDGKIVINTDKGLQLPREYTDNISEVLEQENLIEAVEDYLENKQEELDTLKSNSKPKRFIKKVLFFTGVFLGASIIFLLALYVFSLTVPNGIATFKSIGIATAAFNAFADLVWIGAGIAGYKRAKQKISGIESSIDYITEILAGLKSTLKDSESHKDKEHEQDLIREQQLANAPKQVTYNKARLETINRYLQFYYNLGVKKEEYLKLYQRGLLRGNLAEEYNATELGLIEEYITGLAQTPAEANDQVKILIPRHKN